jgi:putative ABC transport system permease protein
MKTMSFTGRPDRAYPGPVTSTDLRQALARLRHQPLFTLGIVAVLALAIGANTAMFTVVDAVLLRPLPLAHPERLLTFTIVRPGTDRQPLSVLDVEEIAESSRALDAIASLFGWSANVTGEGEAERLSGMRVSANYFEITGAQVARGRTIQAADEHRPVALLAHGLWQRRFGGDPGVVGRSIVLNGEAFTVIGVLRPDFVALVREAEIVVPYSPATDARRANRAQGFLRVIGRLAAGATIAQATDELAAIGRRMRDAYPDAHGTDTAMRVVPLHDEVSGRSAPMLWMLSGAVLIVMLVACANLANLFLVRATSRRRELAVRAALGASRARIFTLLLIEAAILGIVGGGVGLLVAHALIDALMSIGPADLPRAAEIAIDVRVALFTLAVTLGASLLIGAAPALNASRGDLRDALAHGDRVAGSGGTRLRAALLFAEVALSTVLLMTAGLLARSFQHVNNVDPGFKASRVLTIRLSLPRARYQNRAAIESFYNQAQPRIASLPGVRAVSAANVVPMNGYLATTPFYVDGVLANDAPEAHYRMISPDYFRTLGIPLLNGRALTGADRAHTAPVAVVNETFARNYLQGDTPIGRRVRLDDGDKTPREVEVVGVVGNVRHFGLEREATLEVYVPIAQVPDATTVWLANNMYWLVQTEGDPLASAQAVRREIAAVDPAVPASFVRSMDQWMQRTLAQRRFNLQVVGAFTAAALVLALIGVYAVAAFAVSARTREIGIRTALGASRREVIFFVVKGGLAPIGAGLAAGAAIAMVSAPAFSALLFGVTSQDVASLGIGVAALSCAAVLASIVPARRAIRIDPVIALRLD